MKTLTPTPSELPLAYSHFFFVAMVFAVALFSLTQFFGCKKNEPKDVKPEVTLQNLQTAYSREMRISREYALFAKKAEKDRYSAIANLYRAAARSEQIHAEMAAVLMRSKGVEVKPYIPDSIAVGTVMQTLRLASSDESLETDSMYPNLLHSAELEKFPEAVESFKHSLNADKRHTELFKTALDKGGFIANVRYYVCPCCGYIITSDKVDECPECHEKKARFEKI